MKVWVVTRIWSAAYQTDYVSVDRVFASEKAAEEYVKKQESKPSTSYSHPTYEYEEYELQGIGPTNL